MAKEQKYRAKVPRHHRYGSEVKFTVEAEALPPTMKHEGKVVRGIQGMAWK